MVGRTRYALPLSPALERKFDALGRELDVRVLASRARGANGADPRFRLVGPLPVLDGPVFYALAARFGSRVSCARLRPDAVLVQGAQETALVLLGRPLARVPAKVIADLHGDPGAPTRLYGSRLAPRPRAARRRARRVHAIRRADAVRTLSPFTTGIVRGAGVEPAGEFPAFMDLDTFLERPPAPLPDRPAALFVGVLERYKAVEVLAEAWRLAAPRSRRRAAPRRPGDDDASVPERLVAEFPGRVSLDGLADDAGGCARDGRGDRARARRRAPRGCRGSSWRRSAAAAPVVGARAGGIPDIVVDGRNGLLVAARGRRRAGRRARAGAVRPALAERLGAGARRDRRRAGWRRREDYARRTSASSWSVVTGSEAGLRHAGGRSGEPRARRDGGQDPRAGRPRRRGRRARRPGRRRCAARELPRPPVPRRARRAGRGLRFEAALARELARGRAPVRRRAHVPHLRRARRDRSRVRSACRVLLWFTHWKASRLLAARRAAVERRRSPSSRARSRSPRARCARSGTGSTWPGSRAPSARARDALSSSCRSARTSPAKGLETVVRAVALVPEARLVQHGPSLTDEERRHRAELERLVASARRRRPRRDRRRRCRATRCRALLAEADALVNNMRAGATDKVVYEAAATCLPVLASNPALDGFLPEELRFERDDPAGLAERIRALATADRAALGRRAARTRRARPLGRGLGRPGRRARALGEPARSCTWRRRRGSPARRSTCCCLLPQLRERGWDVALRRCCTRASRARWSSRARLEGAGVPVEQRPAPARRRPDRVLPRLSRLVRGAATGARCTRTSCTPTSTASPPAGSPACRCSSRRSTGSTRSAPRRAFAAADRAVGRLARRAHRDLRRAGPLPRSETEGFAEERSTSSTTGSSPGPSRSRTPARRRACCASAGSIPIKGHDVLLRAVARPRRAVPGPRARHRGRGRSRPSCAREVERARPGRSGALPRPRRCRRAVCGARAIVVVPSLGEGFGMVALEAMERGRAVVASDVGGLPEIVAAR